jgi:hypothetical protein
MPKVAKPSAENDFRVGKLHKCAFNPKGADKDMCVDLSGRHARAVTCEAVKCGSPWRVQLNGVTEKGNL